VNIHEYTVGLLLRYPISKAVPGILYVACMLSSSTGALFQSVSQCALLHQHLEAHISDSGLVCYAQGCSQAVVWSCVLL